MPLYKGASKSQRIFLLWLLVGFKVNAAFFSMNLNIHLSLLFPDRKQIYFKLRMAAKIQGQNRARHGATTEHEPNYITHLTSRCTLPLKVLSNEMDPAEIRLIR
jgi:hypothetical protein